MTARIKFHSFRFLFRLFDFLAEKSGGWALFVRPKIILGSLLVAATISPLYSQKTTSKQGKKESSQFPLPKKETVTDEILVTCYETIPVKSPIDTIYSAVEQMPQFKGGEKALYKFINDSLKYTPNDQINGRIICRFAVLSDGSISQIKVLRGLQPFFDEEAIRVIKLMPKWIPGKQNGKAVPVWYTLPIMFASHY